MTKQIIVNVFTLPDGSFDKVRTDAEYEALSGTLAAQMQQDFDTVAVDLFAFLLENPGIKSLPTKSIFRAIWDRKVEAGEFKGKSTVERNAAADRLEAILPEYFKANPDFFHVGRKLGVAFHFVPGDVMTDDKGNVLHDAEGNPVQRFRHTAEEWAKITAIREKEANGNGAAPTVSA